MRILNMLLALHESTKTALQQGSNIGLSKRMYARPYEINRIGKNYDDDARLDISTEFVLMSYLSRTVFINEKYLRGRFLIDELYEKEIEFNKGLWKIYCVEVFNEVLPELPIPKTYQELENIFLHAPVHKRFSLYKTVKEAVVHGTIQNSPHCTSMKDFDLFCCLPGIPGWTSVQHGASLTDNRREAPQRLLQASMGMYRYDYMNAPEPYKNFWKERASHALTKAIALWEKSYITKFRNGAMYEMKPLPEKFVAVQDFNWHIRRT